LKRGRAFGKERIRVDRIMSGFRTPSSVPLSVSGTARLARRPPPEVPGLFLLPPPLLSAGEFSFLHFQSPEHLG